MGLSEHEQRMLDELERGLYADDEKLAKRIQRTAAEAPNRLVQRKLARKIAGAAVSVAGLGVMLVGAIIHYTWMGVAGFEVTWANEAVDHKTNHPCDVWWHRVFG